jgi:hypothetical protein
VVVLPACGGGGGGGGTATGGVDTGGTGSFSTGRVSGFGSVIVNGVRFEDNAARITDDDGAQISAGALRLGMVVSVQGGAVTAGSGDILPSASASAIVVENQIKGPVESKTAPDTLVVFGQTVKVNTGDGVRGTSFASIAVGDILEVSGFADAAGGGHGLAHRARGRGERVQGARHHRRPERGGPDLPDRLRPRSTSRDPRGPPADHAAGQRPVRAGAHADRPQRQRPMAGHPHRPARSHRGPREARLEGILVRNGTQLQVNGVTIDTSRLPAGTPLPVGQKVEVEGALVNGVLVARKIELEDEADDREVDVRGTASAVDTAARTFVVRGLTFHYTPDTVREDDGTIAADLVNGATVRVRGTLPAGGTGNIEATRIDFRP